MERGMKEIVSYHRRGDLPGVELRCLQNSKRLWRHFCTGFELLIPETWQGQVLYRQVCHSVGPGSIFCAAPGHAFSVVDVQRPGTVNGLTLDGEAFVETRTECRGTLTPRKGPLVEATNPIGAMSARLLESMLSPDADIELLRTLLRELGARLLVEHAREPESASRVRGLRGFKHHFGLQ